jgi:hypothetical protein
MKFARASLLAIAASAAVVLGTATAAAAHVEVSADKQQAGATNVTVTFSVEAEQAAAGISAVEVILPAGIDAEGVTKASAPAGWTLIPSQQSVRLAGPPLPAGKDADFSIKVAKFPTDASTLVFKTLVSYTNDEVDRWIEIPVSGQPEPPHPAPILEITGAVSPAPSSSAARATGAASSADAGSADGSTGWVWWVIGAIALVAAAGGSAAIAQRGKQPRAR